MLFKLCKISYTLSGMLHKTILKIKTTPPSCIIILTLNKIATESELVFVGQCTKHNKKSKK